MDPECPSCRTPMSLRRFAPSSWFYTCLTCPPPRTFTTGDTAPRFPMAVFPHRPAPIEKD